jgi:hypothetical protein
MGLIKVAFACSLAARLDLRGRTIVDRRDRMDTLDSTLIARILLTIVTIGYGFVTILVDLNQTHATNPRWTPHARFHVVWQVTSYTGLALLALALVWAPGPHPHERLLLACVFGAIVFGAFFVALASMRLYGGRTHDDNGVIPFVVRIGAVPRKLDVNVSAFSLLTALLGAAAALVVQV